MRCNFVTSGLIAFSFFWGTSIVCMEKGHEDNTRDSSSMSEESTSDPIERLYISLADLWLQGAHELASMKKLMRTYESIKLSYEALPTEIKDNGVHCLLPSFINLVFSAACLNGYDVLCVDTIKNIFTEEESYVAYYSKNDEVSKRMARLEYVLPFGLKDRSEQHDQFIDISSDVLGKSVTRLAFADVFKLFHRGWEKFRSQLSEDPTTSALNQRYLNSAWRLFSILLGDIALHLGDIVTHNDAISNLRSSNETIVKTVIVNRKSEFVFYRLRDFIIDREGDLTAIQACQRNCVHSRHVPQFANAKSRRVLSGLYVRNLVKGKSMQEEREDRCIDK